TATCDTPQLKFWHWYSFEGTTTLYDGGNVKISTNNGQTWTVISPVGGYTGTAASGNTALAGQPIYGGSSNGWVQAIFNLPITAGTRFFLRWHFGTDGSVNNYPGWYIDDVTGIGFAALPPPDNDIGIDAILSPGPNHMPNTPMIPKVKIKNYGGLSQSNFSVICSIVGTAGVLRYLDSVIVPSITSGETLHISLPSWTPTIQEVCTLRFRTKLPNDQVPGNDRMTRITDISPTFQIVIGTATTNSYSGPMNRFYNYSTHEVIYLQPEIGIAGNITRVSYYKDHGTNLDPIENVTIYMKHTTDASLTSGTYSLTGYRQVYSGSFPNDLQSGWLEVQLDTPFVYNNTQNLQILIIKGYQPYISTTVCPYWQYTTTSPTYLTRQAASDASQPTSLTQTYNRPNIRLTITSYSSVAEETRIVPLVTMLNSIKPNPITNGIAKISFSIGEPTHTRLKIYDASGRVIKTLVNSRLESGVYNLIWDGRDESNRKVAEGIYFYTLETPNQKFTKKMVFTR
ncbi:MAG: FlgD immunoglobulin-like domain containing protein, partial [candidate division WOR-3 bacterium]